MAGGDMLTGHTRLPEPNQNAIRIVAVTGFEPILPDPESDVLPLHHTAMKKPAR